MSITFPTTLDTLTNPLSNSVTNNPSHSAQHGDLNDAVEALETKIGVDSSAVETTIDYKLTSTDSSNPGHKHTLADGATDVTATNEELNQLGGVVVGGTSTGDVLTTDGTQTVTGKTFTSPKVNEDVAVVATASELNITDGGSTTEKALNTQCKFRAYLNANQDNLTSGQYTKVLLDSETYDVGNDFDVATNHRFVAPVNGYYMVTANVTFINVIADKRYLVAIYKNNEGIAYGEQIIGNTTGQPSISISTVLSLNATDYVELFAGNVAGANTVDVLGGATVTYMAVHLLSV